MIGVLAHKVKKNPGGRRITKAQLSFKISN